jgi:hypothetical protein
MVVGERNFINKSAKDQMQEAVAEVYSLAGQWAPTEWILRYRYRHHSQRSSVQLGTTATR